MNQPNKNKSNFESDTRAAAKRIVAGQPDLPKELADHYRDGLLGSQPSSPAESKHPIDENVSKKEDN
jgi:hypothetical protein